MGEKKLNKEKPIERIERNELEIKHPVPDWIGNGKMSVYSENEIYVHFFSMDRWRWSTIWCADRFKICNHLALLSLFHIWIHVFWLLIWVESERSAWSLLLPIMSVINTLSLSIYPAISFDLFALHSAITMSICLQSLSFRIVWVKFSFFILLLMLLLLLLFDANRIETGCTHAHRSSLFYHLRFMLIVSVVLSAFVLTQLSMPPMHDMLIAIYFSPIQGALNWVQKKTSICEILSFIDVGRIIQWGIFGDEPLSKRCKHTYVCFICTSDRPLKQRELFQVIFKAKLFVNLQRKFAIPKKQSQIVNKKEKKETTWKDICADKENKIRFAFTASVRQIK